MPTIRFLPVDISCEVPEGTLISEAASQAGVKELHLPCGGKGTCGRCLVEIVEGEPVSLSLSHLSASLAVDKLVLACQSSVQTDLTVRLQQHHTASLRVVGDSHLLVNEDLLPDLDDISPLYRQMRLSVPPASIEEHYSDWQRFTRELCAPYGSLPVSAELSVLRTLAAALRQDEGRITATVHEVEAGLHVTAIEAGHHSGCSLGLAIDIGTTTVAVQLVRLEDGHVFADQTSYNAQIARGADVISRIDYARNAHRQSELCHLILGTLNQLISELCTSAGIDAHGIKSAFIAGNTTMVHLLLALPPAHIREMPYVPTVNAVPLLSAGAVGLKIDPKAIIACAPGVGSYVGGDITAGLLCTELLTNHDEVFLFMDIGTNGEIVLGNAEWMVTCACSAGPAFEGSGIKCGMRAMDGAIEYLEISPDGESVTYDVIGNHSPAGICGSGLISLLGELMLHGLIDQSGRFNMDVPTPRLQQLDTTRAFVLEWGENTQNGTDLIITEGDIENLLRTKAAIFAACSLLLANVGLEWDSISRVIIAGGFGRYVQVEDAILIGLLPDLPQERFSYIGNSALTGAYIALLSRERRQTLIELAGKMTYIDLSSDPHYMDSYLGAMFLPHTDFKLFPSVARRLASLRVRQ